MAKHVVSDKLLKFHTTLDYYTRNCVDIQKAWSRIGALGTGIPTRDSTRTKIIATHWTGIFYSNGLDLIN